MLDGAFRNLSDQLVSLKEMPCNVTGTLDNFARQAELLKLKFLDRILEKKRVVQAKDLGFAAVKKDKNKLLLGIASALGQSVLQGVMSKDPSTALEAGISGFDGFLQGLGESKWVVSLDKQFIVVPKDEVFAGHTWVTWETLHSAMEELRQRALVGESLGNLDSIIDKLKHNHSGLMYVLGPIARVSSETRFGPWHRATD